MKFTFANSNARLVKLADKISNLRDIAASPPADWDIARKRAYFDWASRAIGAMRGTNPELESLFDEAAIHRGRLNAPDPKRNPPVAPPC